MWAEGKPGVQQNQDGAAAILRQTRDGALVTSGGHGLYYETTYRGNVFISANQTGVTTQAGLSATTPALTIYNPKGNTKNVVLLYAGCVMAVANAAAAVIWLGANTNIAAAAVTGTAATYSNGLVGNTSVPSASIFTAATLPAAPIGIAVLGIGLTGAITTIPSMAAVGRFFDGSVIVIPGGAISFQTSTASGASSFFGEFIWEEVPV